MKLIFSALASLLFIPALAGDQKPPEKSATDAHRAALMAAKEITVFEGLPHQAWEGELLAQELKRKDVLRIYKYPFYSPAVAASNAKELKALLSDPQSIRVYGGPKLCGGYHPDFSVSWKGGETTYHALICYGCHEVIFWDGKQKLIYDLSRGAFDKLKKSLAGYKNKRPEPERD